MNTKLRSMAINALVTEAAICRCSSKETLQNLQEHLPYRTPPVATSVVSAQQKR